MLDFPYLSDLGFLTTVRVKLAPRCALCRRQSISRPAHSTHRCKQSAILAPVDTWAHEGRAGCSCRPRVSGRLGTVPQGHCPPGCSPLLPCCSVCTRPHVEVCAPPPPPRRPLTTALPPRPELFHLTGSLKGAVHEWEAATPREALRLCVANDTGTTPPIRQWDPGGGLASQGLGVCIPNRCLGSR